MKNFSRVYSAQPDYLAGKIVSVEIDISQGLHAFSIVGLGDKAVEEARDRVGSAIKNSGFTSPKSQNQKIVVALAPAHLKKEGSFFDLAIAVGYLLSSKEMRFDPVGKIFLGELSLNGEVLPVRGALTLTQTARDQGFTEIYLPEKNKEEAGLVEGIVIYPVKTLLQLIEHLDVSLRGPGACAILPAPKTIIPDDLEQAWHIDFSDIRGQETAKRGLEIAAAGGHNVAMYGPPGTGKTMLAKAFANLLPELSHQDRLEVTGIHSIAGTLHAPVITKPPFRSPHHTASYVSIIGGGGNPKPGEVTLAHKGVLFMDEFPLFDKRVLESLRQPLEDRIVTIARAKGSATFPTAFMLVAAMNPPPADATAAEISRHRKKISGPIMDRIDIWFPVEHIEYTKLSGPANESVDTSFLISQRVRVAREHQATRQKKLSLSSDINAHLNVKDLDALSLDPSVKNILNTSAEKLKLSPRAYHRIIKLARTIADLEGSEIITTDHILEALQYRPKEM